MSLISINPAHAGDAHYRYQMERLRVKSDGRAGSGGGRSTELVNLVDVSRNVRRSPELLLASWASCLASAIAYLHAHTPIILHRNIK